MKRQFSDVLKTKGFQNQWPLHISTNSFQTNARGRNHKNKLLASINLDCKLNKRIKSPTSFRTRNLCLIHSNEFKEIYHKAIVFLINKRFKSFHHNNSKKKRNENFLFKYSLQQSSCFFPNDYTRYASRSCKTLCGTISNHNTR